MISLIDHYNHIYVTGTNMRGLKFTWNIFYERGECITLYSSQTLYKNTDKIFFLLMLHNLPFADTYPDVSRIYLEQLADYLFIYSIFLETDNRVGWYEKLSLMIWASLNITLKFARLIICWYWLHVYIEYVAYRTRVFLSSLTRS